MIETKQLIEFMKTHKGETVKYGDEFSIQVYSGESIQANIRYREESPFIKMEQREKRSITLFWESLDEEGTINYKNGCKLMDSGTIINLLDTFRKHPKVEKALIALLELH